MLATSSFDVTGWEPTAYDEASKGAQLSRVKVRKKFSGDLVGESEAELLMCVSNPADLGAGAGYVASERVEARLAGRSGSFVMQHWGLSGSDGQRTAGHIVPGSGTGELTGLTGKVEIAVDEGGHTLTIDYDLA